MDKKKLTSLIDNVTSGRGIFRTPSYWMRKVLNSIVEYCEGLTPQIEVESEINDSENPVASKAVKDYVDTTIGDINSTIGDIDTILDNINGEVK